MPGITESLASILQDRNTHINEKTEKCRSMDAVMLFLLGKDRKTEHNIHFCMPLEPVFTRDCGSEVHFTDEPTGAPDSKATAGLLKVFREINSDGQTILMVTHSTDATGHTDRILFIKDGEVFHQLYRGNLTNEQLYVKISDTLTITHTESKPNLRSVITMNHLYGACDHIDDGMSVCGCGGFSAKYIYGGSHGNYLF